MAHTLSHRPLVCLRVMESPRICRLLLIGFALVGASPSAQAWGCKGHQVVALIAENHLTPRARSIALQILAAAPIDPLLAPYCRATGDPLADASTWADDIRRLRPETAPWHFIDLPRNAHKSDIAKFCAPTKDANCRVEARGFSSAKNDGREAPSSALVHPQLVFEISTRQRTDGCASTQGCIVSALTEQLRILRDPSASPRARADALRFVIHFVGDIHQPMHTDSNNDLGGNCVPVTFFSHEPVQSGPQQGVLVPNLHEVWDVEILERFSATESPQVLARQLDRQFASHTRAWQSQPPNFRDWAWESHQLAESTAYGRLPHPLPIEALRPMTACATGADIAPRSRVLKGDEDLADDYQRAAAPVIQEQFAKAGARLAALLNSLWP
jgi:nuclease S1